MFAATEINSHSHIHGPVRDPPIGTDLHHDRIQIHDRVHVIKRTGLPGPQLRDHRVTDLGDQLSRNLHLIWLSEMSRDVTSRHTPRQQQQHDVVEPIQAPNMFRHQLRFELAVTVTRHLHRHRTSISQHRLSLDPPRVWAGGCGRVHQKGLLSWDACDVQSHVHRKHGRHFL